MNVKVLKRIEALESKLTTNEKPQIIMIFYDDLKKGFLVREIYGGTKPGDYKYHEILMKHYSGYVFQENFDCNVILNLIGVDGMDGDLFAFSILEVRKKAGLKANEPFSLQYIRDEHGKPQVEFEIIVYEIQKRYRSANGHYKKAACNRIGKRALQAIL